MARKAQPAQTQDAYLDDLRRKFLRAQEVCEPARKEWETDQDYYDGKQWTSEEIAILNKRRQPALVFNEVKPAVNGTIGIIERGRTDPKAWGRTPQDTDAAEVATDALRYVHDTNRFDAIRSQALKDYFVPGVVCAVVEIEEDREVRIRKGRAEEFFYDPYSREPDFSDARYKGLAKWMDESDVLAMTDDEAKRDMIRAAVNANGLLPTDSNQDRPKGWMWADNRFRRLMLVEMYHRKGREWWLTKFVSGVILEDGQAPYKDDKGRSFCNLIAQSAFVDRENQRYGIVRDMRGPQDAINKGRSKVVHNLSVRQVRADPGIMDVDAIRNEGAKPDGVFEFRKDQFEFLDTHTQFTPAHLELLRDAKESMRRQAPTPGIVGRQSASQSGRAILAEQQAGMTEQAPLLAQFDDWVLRIYRACWYCIKQFWDAPKYVRVTDDENAPKYILLNAPTQDPETGEIKIHSPAQMDVDIVIDTTPDTAVIQEEQFAKLVELYGLALQSGDPQAIPFDVIIEASSLPRKKMLLDKMKENQQASPEQQMQQELQMRGAVAEVSEKEASADLKRAQAIKTGQEAEMAGVEPQMRMAEHEGEMQMQREEFGQTMAMKREEHGMKLEQQAQAGQLKAVQGAQAIGQKQEAFALQQQQARARPANTNKAQRRA